MQITPQTDQFLHSKLPIDEDEKILAVYKHHWFAYASSWIIGIIIVVAVMAIAILLTAMGDEGSALVEYRTQILLAAGCFSTLILLGAFVPVYLRSQAQMVLTEEALLQVLQPSLFASKVDQLSLQHITDVSVKQDFFGTLLGYGHITIETPGEQDNYQFFILPNPHASAREIIQAHENFDAALQGGHMPTTLGQKHNPAPQIDPQQYQQFLAYQQMLAQQQQDAQAAQDNDNPADSNTPQDPTNQK